MKSLHDRLDEIAAVAGGLSSEARVYWRHHRPRFEYLLRRLEVLRTKYKFTRILDVGMSFQTLLLAECYPESQLDCLGVYKDVRFGPTRDIGFYQVDLNDVGRRDWRNPVPVDAYDLIIFMEVLEHLYTPPSLVISYLSSLLTEGGLIVVTTPNAAWIKNRWKMVLGKNPFETLKADRINMGHIREYTKNELQVASRSAGLREVFFERLGLYDFDSMKDRGYSWFADHFHSSLSRTLVAVYEKKANQ